MIFSICFSKLCFSKYEKKISGESTSKSGIEQKELQHLSISVTDSKNKPNLPGSQTLSCRFSLGLATQTKKTKIFQDEYKISISFLFHYIFISNYNQNIAHSQSNTKQIWLRNREQGAQDQPLSCFSEEMDPSTWNELWGFTKNSIKYMASPFLSDI